VCSKALQRAWRADGAYVQLAEERDGASRRRMLRRHRDQLEQVLALTLRIAVGGTKVSPTALLALLEEIDRRVQSPVERVVRVLRETA
jgi:hypothetical protein